MEGAPTFENLPSREEVTDILRNRGIDDPEAKEKLLAFDDIGRATADALDEVDGTGNARLEHSLEMSQIYFEAGYQEYAVESIYELLEASSDEAQRQRLEKVLNDMDRIMNP